MIKSKFNLDERLSSAADLIPEGSILLDVGTDHGYLPVKLLFDGKISRGGASDVNSDPLSKAVHTAKAHGVSDKLSFYLSDGLNDIRDIESYTAISICGMGGELIARIISESEYVKANSVPLILQPMSSVEELSVYLADNGFAILDERIAVAAGKIYRVILAAYDGNVRALSKIEHIIGKINIQNGSSQENFAPFIQKLIKKYKRIIQGKENGDADSTEEKNILDEIYRIAEKEGIGIENP